MSTITIHNVLLCGFCNCVSTQSETKLPAPECRCPMCNEQTMVEIPTKAYICKSPSDLPAEMWTVIANCDNYQELDGKVILVSGDRSYCVEWEYESMNEVKYFLSQFKIKRHE
jgi:hypothetical protein